MSERDQHNRRRCTVVGCNPILHGDAQAQAHTAETGHRTAKWPIRSAEGKRRAAHWNRTGYYDKYNVGAKSYGARFGGGAGGAATAGRASAPAQTWGCENPEAFDVGGDFGGYENCGACDWCAEHDEDGWGFGEDDF